MKKRIFGEAKAEADPGRPIGMKDPAAAVVVAVVVLVAVVGVVHWSLKSRAEVAVIRRKATKEELESFEGSSC